ncbi:MAG TPA: hypothetical protein VLW26_12905 [Steroidobacteraceae bacterium]|nr:hypothetical protein [Steroidobacteraceae bacterium]
MNVWHGAVATPGGTTSCALLRESLAQDVDIAERDLFDFAGSRCDRIVSAVLAVVGAGQ